jgi:hypothetical protein
MIKALVIIVAAVVFWMFASDTFEQSFGNTRAPYDTTDTR